MQALLDKLPAMTTPVWLLLWSGLACLTIALLVLMWTRWGQTRALRKCVALSLLAHLLMAGFASTVPMGRPAAFDQPGGDFGVSLVDEGGDSDEPGDGDAADDAEPGGKLWDQFPSDSPQAEVAKAPVADPFTGAAEPPLNGPALQMPAVTEPPVAEVAPAAPTELASQPKEAIEAPLAPAAEVEAEAAPAPTTVATEAGPSPDDVPPPPAADTGPEIPQLADVPPPDNVAEEPLTALTESSKNAAPPELASQPADAGPQPSPATSADWASDLGSADPGPQPIDPAPGSAVVLQRPGDGHGGTTLTSPSGGASVSIPGEGPSATGRGSVGPSAPASAGGAFAGGPNPYQLRTSPGRAALVARQGGSAQTEQAVEAALRWLAAAQSPDGRWDADRFGAGHEKQVEGRDRGRAGADADTGITGLALLAFLGAGHTHQRGPYKDTVQRGLDFLIRSQADNGNLGGQAQIYAMMYSHGMATLALGEAHAMTQDLRLRLPLERAIAYTLTAQHPSEGGWRYRPAERGDTSQLGWQLMALRSAESSGIEVPAKTKRLMVRFLKSVSYGDHGGLAAYRPGERTTRPMTAEALVCRQFLGMARSNPASDEAGQFLMTELPGQGLSNLYYWYYGTLGAYQLQGEHWERWNEALRSELVRSQRQEGDLAGSWDVDQMWGSYGGRVFSTALGAMCLEVYYRYLPLYAETPAKADVR